MDYNKMKVNDLKAELAARNLDTKGVKAVLVERLKEAIDKENSVMTPQSTPLAAVKKPDLGVADSSTPVRRSRRRSMTRSPSPSRTEGSQPKSEEHAETADMTSTRKKRKTRSITKSPSPGRIPEVRRLEVLEEEKDVDEENMQNVTSNESLKEEKKEESSETTEVTFSNKDVSLIETAENTIDNPNETTSSQAEKPLQEAEQIQTSNESVSEDPNSKEDSPLKEIAPTTVGDQPKLENQESHKDEEPKPKLQECKTAKLDESSLTDSITVPNQEPSSKTIKTKVVQTAIEFVAEENEPVIDNSEFLLSWFDSDLNLDIDSKTFDAAKPLSGGAFSLLMAGARANLGVTAGKIAYEVILTNVNEWNKVTEEPVTSEFRVGWSVADTNLQLGEAKHSFAFINNCMKATNNIFTEYGSEYKVNDVIGVYLDLDSNPCKIEYSVNGVLQGTAFEFEKNELEGKALYPHVCSKNIAFQINFGKLKRSLLNERQKPSESSNTNKACADVDAIKIDQSTKDVETSAGNNTDAEKDKNLEANPEKELSIQSDYVYVSQAPINNIILGPCRPETRSECELIFLIGLPASGKTHWVHNYVQENSNKKYIILSIETLLDQMKLLGVPRKPSNTKKWTRLVDQLSKCLNKLTEMAAKRRNNFIFDQPNVFLSEQKRKLRGFGGYATRKAVIVVPDEEEHQRRIKEKTSSFGEEVSEHHLNVMKAHFHLPPKESNWFTEIIYVALDEEKSKERVKKINEEGKKALPRGFNKNQPIRRGVKKHQSWNQSNKRSSSVQHYNQGGYNTQYKSHQQYSQNRNYRQDGRYGHGRQDAGFFYGHYDRNSDWTRGRYDYRYNNRGMRNNSASNYRRWNQPNTNCWSNGGDQGSDAQQWYSWWQSNVKNLLQQQGDASGCSNNSQRTGMDRQWPQYTQQRNYGNYQQPKHK